VNGDYTQAPALFKVRKAARYLRLFGVSRTLIKIKGQYHVKASQDFTGTRWDNPACKNPESASRNVAIIGCGNYSFSNIAYYLSKRDRKFLRAAYDIQKTRSRSLCSAYGGAYATEDWTELLRDPHVKTVFIASNHASHAEYAIACIEAGKHVHIEKPHVVTQEQLDRLLAAMSAHPGVRVYLGFNRPRSVLFKELKEVLDRESGPLMINWFIAGHAIGDDHWYFDKKEGGRVLGNLCHWTDLTLHLVSLNKAFPCTIIPATPADAKSDFIVSVIFADQSCASITFSAKGHTFEGVREVLNVHKGNVLANLTDFQRLTYEIIERKAKRVIPFRDHGHRANIIHSMLGSLGANAGETRSYVDDTARFFLAIREAIDSGEKVVLS
jgi:predicted dehydrogenase